MRRGRACLKASPLRSMTSTSLNRQKTLCRAQWKARRSRLLTKPTALPGCLRSVWCLQDRKIRLRCGGRPMELKTIVEHKLPLNLAQIMEDARSGYQGSEAEKKLT